MTYPVQTKVMWSHRTFEANVVPVGPAPTVHDVTLQKWQEGGIDNIEVVVRFEHADLAPSRPGWPFSLDVTCSSHDANGARLIVTDGSDYLEDFSKIDAVYNISGGSAARRWEDITALTVDVTVTPA